MNEKRVGVRAVWLMVLSVLVGMAEPAAQSNAVVGPDGGDGERTVIVIDRPTLVPDGRRERALVEQILTQAAAHASRVYERLEVRVAWQAGGDRSAQPAAPDFRLTVTGARDASSSTLALTLSGLGDQQGQQATGIPITRPWEPDLYREMAQQIFHTWANVVGFSSLVQSGPPRLVDEMDLNELVGSTLTQAGAGVYPYSIAPMPDGGVVVGAMSLAVHLGPDFGVRSLPGRPLLESGNFSSAMTVASTPAGTVITRPSIGRDLFVYRRGSEEPERLRNPLAGQGAMAALPDGRIILTDLANRRAALVDGRDLQQLDIYQEEWSYIPTLAAGPADTIWTYDTSLRRIRIFSEDGSFLESILPAIPVAEAGGVRAMAVGPRGDALLLTTGGLWRISRSGVPVWNLSSIDDRSGTGLAQMMGVSWDPASGAVWLVDYLGQRVLRLMEEEADRQGFTGRVLELNAELAEAGAAEERARLIAGKAQLYAERGALEMAQSQWQMVLDEDPFHPDALDRIDALEGQLLRREAGRLDTRVRELLDDFGRETARSDFQRTIRLYEQILNLEPGAGDIREARAALEARFEERNLAPSDDGPLRVAASVDPLFPVLLERYRRDGAGALLLENTGAETIEGLSWEITVPGFTTGGGGAGETPSIPPGGRVEAPLQIVLSRDALELQEDLTVAVVVSASYRSGGREYRRETEIATTLHRRSALIWDDSARLASFVTPNEDVVAGFALRSLATGVVGGGSPRNGPLAQLESLSGVLPRAMRIADALGQYGIAYVEDPQSPFSEVQGRAQAVDTVRFPRTTLYYRSGDCDDTSALLASMYEAAGIQTAIVTTPGHVLIAIDIREPAGNRWMYESATTTVIEHGGTLWLPVETTVVSDGFATAWEEGSELVRRHRDAGDVELIPLSSARERYPSLPLPPSSFVITEPPAEVVSAMTRESASYTASLLYENARAQLENQLAARAGSRRVPVLNRLGVLHGRFGRSDRARAALEEAIALRGSYLPAFVNLANVELAAGRPQAALSWLEEAERLRPEEPAVLELSARALAASGEGSSAREYVLRLSEVAPDRADALAVILPRSGQAALGRASTGGDPLATLPPAPWPVDD